MSQLAHRLASGESKAFTELYDLCGNQMHHFLVAKRMSREDAGDLIQDVFLRLVRKRSAFQSVENPVAFAFQVARNEANRWLSRSIRKREQFRLIAADLFVEVAPSQSASTDWRDALTIALAVIPDEQSESEVVMLKIYSEFTLQEIAAITSTPLGTVATRYRLGIGKLRELLGDLE
jgi:RNA polymerase sigma-70 factor (ECF subfamily)